MKIRDCRFLTAAAGITAGYYLSGRIFPMPFFIAASVFFAAGIFRKNPLPSFGVLFLYTALALSYFTSPRDAVSRLLPFEGRITGRVSASARRLILSAREASIGGVSRPAAPHSAESIFTRAR